MSHFLFLNLSRFLKRNILIITNYDNPIYNCNLNKIIFIL